MKDEVAFDNELSHPLIGIINSKAVDDVIGKNHLSFADLIQPFACSQISIKDPNGQLSTKDLRLDFRDVQKGGFFLNNTVLPYIIQEDILLTQLHDSNSDVFTESFKSSVFHWMEPSDFDFLRAYICCIFVILTTDQDPLNELERLQTIHHEQQHGIDKQSRWKLSPPHCSLPKWFMPNILKFYVLVHDTSIDADLKRADELFSTICKNYGSNLCHLLRLNLSTQDSSLPDPWCNTIIRFNRGVSSGLEVAKNVLTSTAATSNQNSGSPENQILQPHKFPNPNSSNIFTISPSYDPLMHDNPNGRILTNGISKLSIHNVEANDPTICSYNPNLTPEFVGYGSFLSSNDRERIKKFVEEFIRELVPFVERQIIEQQDIITGRRGIGKSISNMKKWFGSALANTNSSESLSSLSRYGPESLEFHTRRLADLSFQFGLYNFSFQLYQSLKNDFAGDQALGHTAAALELAALSSFLLGCSNFEKSSNSNIAYSNLQKQYPSRYMENAISQYINHGEPFFALRCVLLSVSILERLESYMEAAYQLIRLSNEVKIPDIFRAVLLEHASLLFHKGNKPRRMAFYSVLAAISFSKIQPYSDRRCSHIVRCCDRSLPLLKGWKYAEDYIMSIRNPDEQQSSTISPSNSVQENIIV